MQGQTLFFLGAIEHSLDIKIEMTWEDAHELLSNISKYNEFTGELAKDILQAADKILPKHQFNGRRDFDVLIGREGSMVMYLRRRSIGKDALNPSDIKMLNDYAADHGQADEADYTAEERGMLLEETFRFWWD